MTEPRSALDDNTAPVFAVPAGGGTDYSASVVAGQRNQVETVSVRSGELEILTLHKIGIRWSGGGPVAADPRIEDTASYVLRRLFLERLRAELDEREIRSAVDQLVTDARQLGDRIWDQDTWRHRPITVDDQDYALFEHTLEGTTIGIADVGPTRIAVIGHTIPADLRLHITSSDGLHYPDSDA